MKNQDRFRAQSLAIIAACGIGIGTGLFISRIVDAAPNSASSGSYSIAPAGAAETHSQLKQDRSHLKLDRSGRKQVGKASFYASRYSGKTMADGTPMRLYSSNAASLTLPLGTTAKVTNLETGKSAVVTIRDRGPYVRGRIVDLSPATARQIGIDRRKGVARVEVAPIAVPLPDGTLRLASLERP